MATQHNRNDGVVWMSFAKWPKTPEINIYDHKYGKNVSSDCHMNMIAAECVCKALQREGFGGDGKVFPLYTWTEPIFEKE